MMEDDEIAGMIERLTVREGGYVDHPSDAGGCTNMGITRATLEDYRGKPTTCADVRALHQAEAVAIYRARWVNHPSLRLSQWPYRKLAEVTLDAAVMWGDGPRMTARWAQEAINAMRPSAPPLEADGMVGPATLAAMVLCDQRQLVAYVVGARLRQHATQVFRVPSQVAFLKGWVNRATKWIMAPNGGNGADKVEPAPVVGKLVLVRQYAHAPHYWTGGAVLGSSSVELMVVSRLKAEAREFADAAEIAAERLLWRGGLAEFKEDKL